MRTCPKCERTYPDNTYTCPLDKSPLRAALRVTDDELARALRGRYRIVRRLGEGGMGTVFLAEQIAVGNRPVALKVLLRKLLDDPEFILRFRNEAASTGRIRHPNVVTIYESGQADDGTPYLAMEYLEGETLSQALRARGALPISECAEILQQAARGLFAAHKMGIIHRDLKPDNIFLTRGDENELLVKVVDFGIAKLLDSSSHTLTGMVLGTPAYMSAEQAAGMRGEELDARSDIYSLGIVAYEMVAGRVPFHAETPLAYVRKHVLEKPPALQVIRADLRAFPELEKVIMKALQKDREQRYASMILFAREFAEAAQALRPSPAPTPIPKPQEPRSQPPPAEAHQARAFSGSPSRSLDSAVRTTPPKAPTAVRVSEGLPKRTVTHVIPVAPGPPVTLVTPETPVPPIALPKTTPIPARAPAAVDVWRLVQRQILSLQGPLVIGAGLVLVAIAGGLWFRAPKPPAGMVYIAQGAFQMGCDKDQDATASPPHSVTLGPFYLDKASVTNAEYLEFVRATGQPAPSNWTQGSYPAGEGKWPVTGVTWADADAYAKWKGKRLPTEAEWEYAARGNDGRLYPWGNNFNPDLSNSVERRLGHPEPVGSHPEAASPFGVLDMSGNVWQWCQDSYKLYPGNPMKLEIPADAKVIRGGSFESDRNHVTTTTRNLDIATNQSGKIGFRCAKSP